MVLQKGVIEKLAAENLSPCLWLPARLQAAGNRGGHGARRGAYVLLGEAY